MNQFGILCFSWNASGLKLCETMSQNKAYKARQGIRGLIKNKECLPPDFFEDIRKLISEKQPVLVVMSTENEDSNNTYFHSEFLPDYMPEIGYSLLKRNKMDMKVTPDSKVITGTPSGSAIRMSIYARSDYTNEFMIEENIMVKFFKNNGQMDFRCQYGDSTTGAIGAYVWHETYGKFLFITAHLVPGVKFLNVTDQLNYENYRSVNRSINNLCMISLMNQFVDSLAEEAKPNHIFLLGDLNSDIVVPGKKSIDITRELTSNTSIAKIKEYHKYDELKKVLDDAPLNGFKEGVSGEGPLFMPTWKLVRGREDSCVPNEARNKIDQSCYNQELSGSIGWHDRILFKEMLNSNYAVHCINYQRLDVKNMHASTHAGVVGLFSMNQL